MGGKRRADLESEEESSSDGEDEEESEEEELDIDEVGRVAVGGSVDYGTRCFDGAISIAPDALSALCADCHAVFTARASGDGEGLSSGCTFWVGAGTTPTSAIERLALDIFEYHARNADFDAATSGAEWWTQTIDPDDDIGLHWDRDYDMQADQGLLLHPHIATVTYLSAPGGAAPTIVFDSISPLLASESPCGHVPRALACWPFAGRHLCFDGRKLHGAMQDLAGSSAAHAAPVHASGKGKASKKGKASQQSAQATPQRITFLVNVWFNHVPWGAEPLPESVVRRLHAQLPGVQMELGDSRDGDLDDGVARRRGKQPAAVRGAQTRGGAAARPPARLSGAGTAQQWTFGDVSSRLTVAFPWPADAVRELLRCEGGAAPFAEIDFAGGAAELRPATPKGGAKRKQKQPPSAKGGASAKKRK